MLANMLALFLVLFPVIISVQSMQEELQIAVRRYMQCQADNVGTYNVQVQLSQKKFDLIQAELNDAKEELAKLKTEKKDK